MTSLDGNLICLSKSGFATLQCGIPNWFVFLSQIVVPNWVLPIMLVKTLSLMMMVTRFVVDASIESNTDSNTNHAMQLLLDQCV